MKNEIKCNLGEKEGVWRSLDTTVRTVATGSIASMGISIASRARAIVGVFSGTTFGSGFS